MAHHAGRDACLGTKTTLRATRTKEKEEAAGAPQPEVETVDVGGVDPQDASGGTGDSPAVAVLLSVATKNGTTKDAEATKLDLLLICSRRSCKRKGMLI